jgi:transcriptional antiterminator NusG
MNWFALTVKPQHEKAVLQQLEVKDLEGYSPFYRARRRWSDRIQPVELPLFPRYVFCRFTFEQRLKVLSSPGVHGIVGFGGKPCPVSEDEIAAVKAMVDSNKPVMPWPFVRVGQRVRVCDGSLSGLEGTLIREKADYKIVVNVQLLNRAVAVELDRDRVESIHGSSTPTTEALIR